MTTQTLLEELHALGVAITTDGTTLTVDAPKGVMTPAFWEQLSSQKQEIIKVLQEAGQDEPLYAFARAISGIVNVLGGPGTVSIEVSRLPLEEYMRTIRPPYQPVTLPNNPRSTCPFQMMVIKRCKDGDHQVAGSCKEPPLEHGWCADHARSHDLLCLGARLGYPPVAFGYRSIEEGVANWEAYAQSTIPLHLERDMASIYQQFRDRPGPPDLSRNGMTMKQEDVTTTGKWVSQEKGAINDKANSDSECRRRE